MTFCDLTAVQVGQACIDFSFLKVFFSALRADISRDFLDKKISAPVYGIRDGCLFHFTFAEQTFHFFLLVLKSSSHFSKDGTYVVIIARYSFLEAHHLS